jgi:hypothetical protein
MLKERDVGTVFISYRRDTASGEARALFNDLVARLGKGSVFMDVDSISLGRDFRSVLQKTLESCDVMLVIIDKGWAGIADSAGRPRLENPRDYVRMEVEAALKRDIVVTPVLVEGAAMPADERLPPEIRDLAYRNGFEISHTRWDSDVRELVKRLGLDISEENKQGGTHQAPIAAGPVRLYKRAVSGALAVIALILIVAVGYEFFRSSVTRGPDLEKRSEHAGERTSFWTLWMDQASYQQEFEKQVKNKRYPTQIQIKAVGNEAEYRAHFEPFPADDFAFYSRHSLDDDAFSEADTTFTKAGFTRVYQQRVLIGSRAYNQGTWTKP